MAAVTPGAVATIVESDAGIVSVLVNAPLTPAGNTHASAPIALTVLLVSLRSEAVSPLNTSVIAKTSAAASVATTNLRRRHTRSWKPTNHIAVSPHVADQPT